MPAAGPACRRRWSAGCARRSARRPDARSSTRSIIPSSAATKRYAIRCGSTACARRPARRRRSSASTPRPSSTSSATAWTTSSGSATAARSESALRAAHAQLRHEPDHPPPFLVGDLPGAAERLQLLFVLVRRDGEAVLRLLRRIGRLAPPLAVHVAVHDEAARAGASRRAELHQRVGFGGTAGIHLLRGEHASDERGHHVLQALLRLAERFDESRAG